MAASACALAANMLAASALSGCGGGSQPAAEAKETSTPAPQPSAAPKTAESPVPAAAAASNGDLAAAQPIAAQPKAAPPAQAPVAQPKPASAPPPKPAAAPPPAAKPTLITLPELVARRDLWPAKVVLKKPFQLSRSVSIPAGHEVAVYALEGTEIQLDTGTDLIQCPAADTDVLERASEILAALTPEQRALTEATLASRSDLWPLRLVMTRPLQFQNGTTVPAGREVILRTFENGLVNVYDRQLATFFQAEVHETDVLARARERLALPEAERTPFFVRSVGEALEPAAGEDADFEKTDLLLVYKARLGCTRCAAFAPELKEFYGRIKAEHPGFETVFLSDDSTGENARALVEKEELPGRVVAFDRRLEAADLASQGGQLLPLVFLYDRDGKLVAKNHPSGGSPSAADILAEAEKRLKTAR
jgi:hypothetical protein